MVAWMHLCPQLGSISCYSQNSIQHEVTLFDLDIDSDNNNKLDFPDGNQWEEQIESHEFSIGKLILAKPSQFTPRSGEEAQGEQPKSQTG
jgi:hypothetical protein